MNNPTCKIILRPNYTNVNGSKGVYLQLTINRKTNLYSLGIPCIEKDWNSNNHSIKKSDPESFNKNMLIDSDYNKAREIILKSKIERNNLSFEKFRKDFRNENYGSLSIFVFIESMIKKQTGVS